VDVPVGALDVVIHDRQASRIASGLLHMRERGIPLAGAWFIIQLVISPHQPVATSSEEDPTLARHCSHAWRTDASCALALRNDDPLSRVAATVMTTAAAIATAAIAATITLRCRRNGVGPLLAPPSGCTTVSTIRRSSPGVGAFPRGEGHANSDRL
jgi:hypothetical protein